MTATQKSEIWGFEWSYGAVNEKVIRPWLISLADVCKRETKLYSRCICFLTLSDSECGGIDQEEKDVIEETLEDGCIGMEIF